MPVPHKQSYIRTNISLAEKTIGSILLLLLIGIGVSIQQKGRSYDPNLFSVDETTLESTRNPVLNKASTLKEENAPASGETVTTYLEEDYSAYEDSYSEPAVLDTGESVFEKMDTFSGFKAMSDTEYYSADTLYEKINGRAPAYLGFNFQKLTCRTFTIKGVPGQYLDAFIFEMDTPVNAFGIFSMEREAGAKPLDFVNDGYRSEMGFFFRQGNAYIQVIASDVSEQVLAAAEEFSRITAAKIQINDTGVEAASILPMDQIIEGSISYIQENAYGLALLNDVFEARYEIKGLELSFFAMKTDPSSAQEALESVQQFFQDYGTVIENEPINGCQIVIGESFGQYSVVYLKNDELGGVMNADDLPAALTFIETFLKKHQP